MQHQMQHIGSLPQTTDAGTSCRGAAEEEALDFSCFDDSASLSDNADFGDKESELHIDASTAEAIASEEAAADY